MDRNSPYRFNQYLYVEGGGTPATQIVYMRKSLPLAQLKVTPSSGGRIVGLKNAVRTDSDRGGAGSTHAVGAHGNSLYDGEKKIEFVNHITKDPVRDKEAVYFAFPVATPKPSFQYEIQNGWVDPSKDLVKGAGLEWFTVGHWAKASGADWMWRSCRSTCRW